MNRFLSIGSVKDLASIKVDELVEYENEIQSLIGLLITTFPVPITSLVKKQAEIPVKSKLKTVGNAPWMKDKNVAPPSQLTKKPLETSSLEYGKNMRIKSPVPRLSGT